jgi:catechol 2,3-dioxygenase-like lactoylglutathione lyase family enzyme
MTLTDVAHVTKAVDDNGTPVIAPTLHHTGNQTARMDEMLAWYRNVLGQVETLSGVPPQTVFPSVWTSNDWAHHRMGFLKTPTVEATEFSATSPGVQHTAWEYASLDDLLSSWERITKVGINPLFCVNHGISYAFYYRDPDGNLVELLCDAFGDHERSKEVILTNDAVRSNPAGTPVDPNKLAEARRAGMDLDEIYERSYAGELSPDGGGKAHHLPDDQAYIVEED